MQSFRSSLHFAQSQFRYCVGGHPVPSQHNRMSHSAWKGVAVLSKYPTREVPTTIPKDVHAAARTLVTTTLVHDAWLTGGTVYGEPESSSYPHHKQNTEELLHHVASHVCHLAVGPRFIAGDWNCSQYSLPAFEMIEAAGFRELQDLAAERWGMRVSNTCKQATRKDFCYVSRELQHLLWNVSLSNDTFPDHAVLYGQFHALTIALPRQIWVSPTDFPWPKTWEVDPSFWLKSMDSPAEKYESLWKHIEDQAAVAVPHPVSKRAFGRAKTRDVRPVVAGKIPPPRRARKGDIQPQFVCASFRHAQWLRQLRRLQCYLRHVGVNGNCTVFACQVWGAIIRSTGFPQSFSCWWKECSFKTHGAVDILPLTPPTLEVGQKIFDSFTMAFRSFELELQKASRCYAKQRREQNPNVIFQDLRADPTRSAEILLKPVGATVEQVRVEEHEVVLEQPITLDTGMPIFCNGHRLNVTHAEADALWVENIECVQTGDRVTQVQSWGTDDELFSLFLGAWRQMWGRHQNVPHDRWDVILKFARDKLRPQRLQWPMLDVMSLQESIAYKKPTTSGGLDGVSLGDLKAMPVGAISNFLAMFSEAEQTGHWPIQVVSGRVACIPKTDCPREPLDFRPITVLGLLYRCWGTYHARQAIRAIDTILPLGLYGSRPQRYAGQVWSQLLWTVEFAYETHTPLCGIVADIQKAFNFLPRVVVLESCAILGIPFPVLVGWAGALAMIERRFQLNGSLSPAAPSSCGLPEGCALSCVGMMIVDVLFHEWMTHFFPLCQPLTYVDDWQVLVLDPTRLQPVFECLQRFTEAMDIFVDRRKTHMWSVCARSRSLLRSQGFDLVAGGKNLGAHVQFTKMHTNKSLMDRIHSAGYLWTKLRLSASPYALKVRALKVAAWPRCLHAVAATTISNSTFTSLRAGAMKGLKADAAGANPMVQLGLIEHPNADPQFWAILQTCRLVRDCGSPPRVEQILAGIAQGTSSLPLNSITNTLLTRLQGLGWHIDSAGRVCDLLGPFSLFHVSAAELRYRAELQWPLVVDASLTHRGCFQGLDRVDPEVTRKWLATLHHSDQALFRKVLNGSHITQDGKFHCQEAGTNLCPFCQCSDSRFHRFWICSHFEHLRAEVPPEVLNAVVDLPEVLTCSGWALMPTTQHEWNEYFVSLPDVDIETLQGDQPLHLFTDGSCLYQHDKNLRFAGWAIGIAGTIDVHEFSGSRILASGVLPGLLQSAVRAETYGVWKALQAVQDYPGSVMLWVDCDSVVRRLRRLLAGGSLAPHVSHSDLWGEILQCLNCRCGETAVTKVAAHQDLHEDMTVLEEWCALHNAMVDKQAVRANLSRPSQFWQLFARHSQAMISIGFYNWHIQTLQLRVSREVVRSDTPCVVEAEPMEVALPPPINAWEGLPELHVPLGAVRWYGDPLVRLMLSWLWGVLDGTDADLIWVSHFQLYGDFMLATGHPGPVHEKRWLDGAELPRYRLRGFAFKQRTRWFIKVLKQALKHCGVHLECAYGKPVSRAIQMYTGCVALPWDVARLDLVDRWLLSCSQTTFKRQSKALDAIPLADRNDEFHPVFVSTIGM